MTGLLINGQYIDICATHCLLFLVSGNESVRSEQSGLTATTRASNPESSIVTGRGGYHRVPSREVSVEPPASRRIISTLRVNTS